jgi:hypothetical protein
MHTDIMANRVAVSLKIKSGIVLCNEIPSRTNGERGTHLRGGQGRIDLPVSGIGNLGQSKIVSKNNSKA